MVSVTVGVVTVGGTSVATLAVSVMGNVGMLGLVVACHAIQNK